MASILRAAPPLSRAFCASALRAAATAPSTSATSSKATTSSYYSSRYARAPTATATGSGYKRAAYTKAPASTSARPVVAAAAAPAPAARAPAAAAPAPTPAAASPADYSFDDMDDSDFRLPDTQIEDYAHLRKPAAPAAAPRARTAANTPSASPPLTNLPDESYVPLPAAAPDSYASPPAGPSAPGAIGSSRLQDGYVFTAGRLPGELVSDDWTTSFRGLSERPFPKEAADALLRPLSADDVEIKPDGLLYLPEIKYRRTLNAAFGPGGWGMAPRGETHVGPRIVSREWGLVCLGRLVAIARGEQEYFDPSGVPTATEACKSNALMRCCKDLGIGSELWDPRFIREFKAKHCVEAMVEHVSQKRKRKLWRKKENKFEYPYKEISAFSK